MKRRAMLISAASTPVLGACNWDRFFDLSWEEEVKLHDGRVIIVKLKYTYERISTSNFGRYESAIPRDTEMSFDAGAPYGFVSQTIKGFNPMFLDQKEGVWYMVMYGSPYRNSENIPGQDWGPSENGYGQRTAILQDGQFKSVSMRTLPEIFIEPNMLMLYGSAAEHAKFKGTRVTLAQKRAFLEKHPLGYSHVRIARPLPGYPKPATPPTDKFQGVPK